MVGEATKNAKARAESMVAGSEEIREMRYYSDVLLSSEYAKEARIYHYFDFFIQKRSRLSW